MAVQFNVVLGIRMEKSLLDSAFGLFCQRHGLWDSKGNCRTFNQLYCMAPPRLCRYYGDHDNLIN